MQHLHRVDIQQLAEISADGAVIEIMTKAGRLRRWADLLERSGDLLNTLEGTEHLDAGSRRAMRCDNSPFTVAYNDPVLRAAGLEGDTYGEIERFFKLTDRQLHFIVCSCTLGGCVSGNAASARVRTLIPWSSRLSSIAEGIRRWFS